MTLSHVLTTLSSGRRVNADQIIATDGKIDITLSDLAYSYFHIDRPFGASFTDSRQKRRTADVEFQ